jgi:hypothetical protein
MVNDGVASGLIMVVIIACICIGILQSIGPREPGQLFGISYKEIKIPEDQLKKSKLPAVAGANSTKVTKEKWVTDSQSKKYFTIKHPDFKSDSGIKLYNQGESELVPRDGWLVENQNQEPFLPFQFDKFAVGYQVPQGNLFNGELILKQLSSTQNQTIELLKPPALKQYAISKVYSENNLITYFYIREDTIAKKSAQGFKLLTPQIVKRSINLENNSIKDEWVKAPDSLTEDEYKITVEKDKNLFVLEKLGEIYNTSLTSLTIPTKIASNNQGFELQGHELWLNGGKIEEFIVHDFLGLKIIEVTPKNVIIGSFLNGDSNTSYTNILIFDRETNTTTVAFQNSYTKSITNLKTDILLNSTID